MCGPPAMTYHTRAPLNGATTRLTWSYTTPGLRGSQTGEALRTASCSGTCRLTRYKILENKNKKKPFYSNLSLFPGRWEVLWLGGLPL